MKKNKPFIILLALLIAFPIFAQEIPQIGFAELMELSEEDFNMVHNAKKLTTLQNIPHTIYIEEGVFIEARGVENGKVVYAIYNNLVNIYDNGETAFWEEINSRYDLSNARLHYVIHPTLNPTLGFPEQQDNQLLTKMLLVTDWTSNGVMTFDATTGDLLNASFIVDPTNLSSPKEANLAPWGKITVSDQVKDGVMEYDTAGTFLRFFAPAGGVNNSILNNIRGHNFRPNGNLVVTNFDAPNNDAVAEFDNAGNYLGNFIANGLGGLVSPFDIIFRTGDCLVSASTSDAVHRYDLNGAYLDDFATGISFAQQVYEMPNGNIAVAGFSTPSGIYIYSPTGTLLKTLSVVTGVRSAYLLPNGNILTTNGTGLHEIDSTSGAIIRTIVAGSSLQYISLYDYSIIPVELTSFIGNVVGGNVVLSWSTATETNNSGFQVERSNNNEDFVQAGFVPGFGTTTESKSYTFADNSSLSGTHYYKLKQIDYDGSFTYSEVVEVNLGLPSEFALQQNYPNPFNPSTKITFTIAANALVTLKVFDVLGQEVMTLINQDLTAGVHTYDFDEAGFNSGVYFYRIEANGIDGTNFTNVKKMILLK
jgi:hypothetical protein